MLPKVLNLSSSVFERLGPHLWKDLNAQVLLLVVGMLSMFDLTDDCRPCLLTLLKYLLGLEDTLVPFCVKP